MGMPEATRLTVALPDQTGTDVTPARQEILDIDDTFWTGHGGQPLSFWNAHHDERALRVDGGLPRSERHSDRDHLAPGAHPEWH